MTELLSVHPRSNMLGLKRKRENGLEIKNVKYDEKLKINAFYMFFKKMDTMVSIFNSKKFLNVLVKIITKKYFFTKMSSEDENSTSTKICSEELTQASMNELPSKSDSDSFATLADKEEKNGEWAATEQALELHEDLQFTDIFSPEVNELFAPEKPPVFKHKTKIIMPWVNETRAKINAMLENDAMTSQSSRGKAGRKVSWDVDVKSPEELRALKLNEGKVLKDELLDAEDRVKESVMAEEGVLERRKRVEIKRKVEKRTVTPKKMKNDNPPRKSNWDVNAKSSGDWGFACSDIRFRNSTTPGKSVAPPMGGATNTDAKKAKIEKKSEFLAKSVALMVKDVKVPKRTPNKPTKPKTFSPKKAFKPLEKAFYLGSVPVTTYDPKKPLSASNPILSADKNGPKIGEKYRHSDYNKKAKIPVDAETETDEIKARHVHLCTPTRVGPTIVDPNQYVLEAFNAYEKVPILEAEVELQKMQKVAVESEFMILRKEKRELELALNGARREKEDAVWAEDLEREAKEVALREVVVWKRRAEEQRDLKKKLKKENGALHEKIVGKVIRALEKLSVENGETDGGKSVKQKMSEMVSKDTEEPDSSEELSF